MIKIALNGFGRIGKLALRRLFDNDISLEFINDKNGDPDLFAHLLEFDTVHGRWNRSMSNDSVSLTVDNQKIPVFCEENIDNLPLDGIDIVIDCTGFFKSEELLAQYSKNGVQKVIVSAPVKAGTVANLVYGVNENIYDPNMHNIVTAASCTTNCLAPIVKVVHESLGIKHGSITTIHNVTNTQTIVDRPSKDFRRSRSALNSLIPTTTGSATAINLIYPELNGKLNGSAVRVPLLNASLTDAVFELNTSTTVSEVNGLFENAAETYLKDILGYESRALVSSDFVNDPRSCIIDGQSTIVVDSTHLKVYAWYDNEWAYVSRLVDIVCMVKLSLDAD